MDNIKNGDVVYSQGKTHQGKYPEHTTGTITCDEGYIVSGNNITTCQNDGTWSSIPSCESESLSFMYMYAGQGVYIKFWYIYIYMRYR